jgi:L-fuconate dehydratase
LTLSRNGARCRRHARAGGVGLCELVQHRSMFDFIAMSSTTGNRVTEFVDHLHEHFMEPV